jgi:hypothetical protein
MIVREPPAGPATRGGTSMPVDTFIADVGVYPSVGDAETDYQA